MQCDLTGRMVIPCVGSSMAPRRKSKQAGVYAAVGYPEMKRKQLSEVANSERGQEGYHVYWFASESCSEYA